MPSGVVLQAELPWYRGVVVPAAKFLGGFLAVYLAGRLFVVPATVRVVRARNRNNPAIQKTIKRYVRGAVVVVAVAVGTAVAGYGDVLTRSSLVVAAATLAVGVAGQEVIGNLVSGLFLVADPEFTVGDWISWGDREGVVESISFRVTRVRTSTNELVSVPNTELATNGIARPYGREQFRVTERVSVDYDDNVEVAMALMREAAAESTAVLDDPGPRSYLVEFGDDALVLEVHYWLRSSTRRDILRVRSTYALRLKRRFEGAGLTLSPPSERELGGRLVVDRGDGIVRG